MHSGRAYLLDLHCPLLLLETATATLETLLAHGGPVGDHPSRAGPSRAEQVLAPLCGCNELRCKHEGQPIATRHIISFWVSRFAPHMHAIRTITPPERPRPGPASRELEAA